MNGIIAFTLVFALAVAHGFPALDFLDGSEHKLVKRDSMDFDTLKQNPQVQEVLKKLQEAIKKPEIAKLLKSEAIVNLLKPDNLKKVLADKKSEALFNEANVKKWLDSDFAKKVMTPDQIQQAMSSDTMKQYISRFKEMLPPLIQSIREYLKL